MFKVPLNTTPQPTQPILSKQNYLMTFHPKLILSTFIVIQACYLVIINSKHQENSLLFERQYMNRKRARIFSILLSPFHSVFTNVWFWQKYNDTDSEFSCKAEAHLVHVIFSIENCVMWLDYKVEISKFYHKLNKNFSWANQVSIINSIMYIILNLKNVNFIEIIIRNNI